MMGIWPGKAFFGEALKDFAGCGKAKISHSKLNNFRRPREKTKLGYNRRV